MNRTGIEYLDFTWNPIAMRCTGISPGCEHCWHLRTADRLAENPLLPIEERRALIGDGPFILRDRELSAPLRQRKPAVIGVQFMGDLFHEAVPDEFIAAVGKVIYDTMGTHTYLILTKRPTRMMEISKHWPSWWPFENSYLGLTVCNQPELDAKLPEFLQVPGKKFLSIEPLLGPIDLTTIRHGSDPDLPVALGTQWGVDAVILGGETGPGARPLHPDWVRSVRDQCAAAGVPFFFKGWGAYRPAKSYREAGSHPVIANIDHSRTNFSHCYHLQHQVESMIDGSGEYAHYDCVMVKDKAAGRLLDGQEHNELPWRLA